MVVIGLVACYLLVGLLFWLFVMTHGGFRQSDGRDAPLVPCLIATVLMWPAAVASLEVL